MSITKQQFAGYIKDFNLRELFIDGLGWNFDHTAVQPFEVDGVRFAPKIIADKNGFKIAQCACVSVPLYAARIQVLNALKSRFAELLVIFTDNKQTRQVWLYGYKVSGQNKKAECEFRAGQDPQALYERAAGLFFSLDEEGNITILDVVGRVRDNFTANAERVTKRFYNEFKTEHTALLGFIRGITETVDKEWYASIMLNRLMFCYFMQKRGFLDKNRNYLRDKLMESKEKLGDGKFYSFYRSFLMILFLKGFGTYEHSPEIKAMIGDIPYLNGGLFDLHEIERNYPDIDISDEAFQRIFILFDRYEWHLDTRECASGDEISPDVLGYIFEKYINDRAAMGAYYTQEDITGYISRSTILPYLLEATKKAYGKPFEKGGSVWKFLSESGDRYVFESMKRGLNDALPENIAIGVDTTAPNLIERRRDWNEPVPENTDHLPTEIWREFIERTKRCRATIDKIKSGEINDVSDFITYNLDIVSFVGDLLDTIEDPKFIQVFYTGLEKVTILDPTCGSGAFLFAALNILEPLYASCLSRMEDYVDHDYKGLMNAKMKAEFLTKLANMKDPMHPGKQYFIYKSIILNNLYGVDIMREAVETAKLRLFLKLVSTAEPNYRAENIGIEPLPDIDFNIKAGNTLIGYANEQEVQDALNGNLMGLTKISETMDAMLQLSKAVSRYKQLQLGAGDYRADDWGAAKADLSARQANLRAGLDKLLRDNDYPGIDESDWQNNYQPFHWVSEFYSIIAESGGFDVIIGNPPYVEYSKVRKQYTLDGYETLSCGNLYAYVLERSKILARQASFLSMIVPMSGHSTERMESLVERFYYKFSGRYIMNLSADAHPSLLFAGVKFRLAIFVISNTFDHSFSTKYKRWYSEERNALFSTIVYTQSEAYGLEYKNTIMKNPSVLFDSIFRKIYCNNNFFFSSIENNTCLYHNCPVNWIRSHTTPPFFKSDRDGEITSTQLKTLKFHTSDMAKAGSAILCSSAFFVHWLTHSDCYHLNNREILSYHFSSDTKTITELANLCDNLQADMRDKARRRVYNYATTGRVEYDEFYMKLSKPIIDQIDTILAEHYGFTEEELDYIINYDIKYRMGLGGAGSGGDDE